MMLGQMSKVYHRRKNESPERVRRRRLAMTSFEEKMKQIIILSILFMATCAIQAQNIAIEIPGLHGKGKTTITAQSAQMMTSAPTTGGRGGGGGGSQYYLITRSPDRQSAAIQDASQRGRAFRNILLISNLADGTKVVRRFNQALISDYQVTVGAGSTETFRIAYDSETVQTY